MPKELEGNFLVITNSGGMYIKTLTDAASWKKDIKGARVYQIDAVHEVDFNIETVSK